MTKRIVVILLALLVTVSLAACTLLPWSKKSREAGADKIAVIYVEGVIMGGRGQSDIFGGASGMDGVIRQLHKARDDSSVKAIVLRINSPGGSAPASQEVGTEIKKLRASGKIVVTSMGDMAASGGYWLAAVTDKIYANPATLTGSIGVYIPYSNWEELYKKIGIHQEKIKSGPHKDILSPERMITKEERAIIQAMVDDLYAQFVTVVAEGRNMDPKRVRELADGRIYTGRQAKELGLIDEFGTMYDAIDGAAKMAGITGKPQIKEYGTTSPWAALLGGEEVSIEKLLLRKPAYDTLLTAPLAMPVEWQVE